MKDKMGNTEVERRASYYEQPWCDEAVPRYFYAKVSHFFPAHLCLKKWKLGDLGLGLVHALPISHTHTRSHQVNQRKSELEQVLDIRHPWAATPEPLV